ncbi:hypothetical protein [Embleya sp. NPDC020630]|uniref:hypothetical protein n=1 Tax=Embleya sp. NPDC020630 TaxID=3363979 RepID=UPI0037BC6F7D
MPEQPLPAPTVPLANRDGIISRAQARNGITVHIEYPASKHGDTITLYWGGQSQGDHTVTEQEIAALISFPIPTPETNRRYYLYYTVTDRAGTKRTSSERTVTLTA